MFYNFKHCSVFYLMYNFLRQNKRLNAFEVTIYKNNDLSFVSASTLMERESYSTTWRNLLTISHCLAVSNFLLTKQKYQALISSSSCAYNILSPVSSSHEYKCWQILRIIEEPLKTAGSAVAYIVRSESLKRKKGRVTTVKSDLVKQVSFFQGHLFSIYTKSESKFAFNKIKRDLHSIKYKKDFLFNK